ncbi:MAG: hypothetical protein HZA19_05700 [Nitrospirae bacterium]|nr:hypothetical protein [Nitrospirota bacterium]
MKNRAMLLKSDSELYRGWKKNLHPVILLIVYLLLYSPVYAGEAILSWEPPATNADGTPLTDLAGYKVYYGTASGSYGDFVDAGNVITYTVSNLPETVAYYFAVTAYNTTGNESGYSNEASKTIPDTTPPVVSEVSTNSITSTGAVITWNTNEASTSQIEYGTTTSYGASTTQDIALVTSHSVTLSGLSAWTTYHFRAKSLDAAGNPAASTDLTFTTLVPPDITPPTGTISINDGAAYTTSTTVTLTLSCSDDGSGCSQMQFSNDGTAWSAWEAYAASKLSTLTTGDGDKTVYARYQDGSGNISSNYSDTITLDTVTPAISGTGTSSITDSLVTITWVTSEPAATQVEYGTSVSLGSSSPKDSTLVVSHSVTLAGLSPNTTYHFKVLSLDGAGNSSISSENIFVTLQPAQPDQPAAILDLRVQTGSSTRNTVVLEWTATGSDGTGGTATSSDLRISKMKIIDDGLSPNGGEVTFSNAIQVAGVPVPQSFGTLQSVQISGLETNTVYYFAIKAIDEKGNISPLSNVINGGLVPPLPVTALRQGYTMISFPLVPETSDVQTLLSPIVGAPVELYWWSSSGLVNNQGSFVAETNVVPGYGYFLKTDSVNAVLAVSGTPVTDPNRVIPLQTGWNIIGNPYPNEILLKDTSVRNVDTGEIKTFEDAVIAGWVGNAVYNFNGSTYDFSVYGETKMKLWHGYWFAVLKEGVYELVVPKP